MIIKAVTILSGFAAVAASPALAANVTGPRAEVVIGWDNVGVDVDGVGDGSRSGVVYGLGLGYDVAVGTQTSIGIDAEISDATTDLEETVGGISGSVEVGRDLYVGGRLTTAVSDKVNLYAKIGYTNARVKASVTIDGETVSDAENGDGVRGGFGGQFMLTPNSYVGAEYRYSNYEADFSRHQIAATFGFRF